MPQKNEPTQPAHTFETAMERLEQIVQEMESDKMPLENLLTAYEDGTQLVKVCQQQLRDAEKKIEIIQRRANADPELKEFDPAAKADSPAPRPASARDANLF